MIIEVDIKGHNFVGSQEMNTEYYIFWTYSLHVPVLCRLVPGTDCTGTHGNTVPWDGTGLMLKIQVVSHVKGKPLLCAVSQENILFSSSNTVTPFKWVVLLLQIFQPWSSEKVGITYSFCFDLRSPR